MKAVIAHGKGDLRIDDVPDPTCGPDEVIVEVAYGGICGSDLHYYQHGATGLSVIREPLILGHEIAGRIVEVGSAVIGWRVGQPVTPHPSSGCRGCPPALAGSTAYFGSAGTMPHTQGAFSQYRSIAAYQLRALPDDLDIKRAALTEPLSVAMHAVTRAGSLAGKTVLVSGCGPIGNLIIAAARIAGAARIYAADLQSLALDLAQQSGADEVVDLAARGALPRDVDVTFEASAAPAAVGAGLAATRRGGTMIQVGNLRQGDVTVQLAALVSREIDYLGTFRFDEEIVDAVAALAAGVAVDHLVTHTFPLAAAHAAFDVASDRTRSSKVMLQLS